VKRHDPLELVGQMRAPVRLAPRERLFGPVIGVRQVVDAGQERSEELAVRYDASHRDAAEADAVVAALAPDQAGPLPLAADVPVGQRDLQRRIDGLGAGIAEEYVVEVARGELGEPRGEGEPAGMAELEGRREIERFGLGLDRRDDLIPVVAGIAAPQAGDPVEHGPPFGRVVVHALGARDHPGALLEGAVGGEGKPPCLQVVRHRSVVGGSQALRGHQDPLVVRFPRP
jgi:hypothetical protein